MVGDQLVPRELLGAFLCASGFELLAPLLVSRRSLLLIVGVKNDADWRRGVMRMWCGCHKIIVFRVFTLCRIIN